MPGATRSVKIARSPADVYAYLGQPENDPTWRPAVTDIAHASGTGVGAVYRQGVRGPGGRRVSADIEITAAQPDRLLSFRTVTGPVRPSGRYELAPTSAGTSLTFTLEVELRGLKKLFIGGAVQKSMNAEVANLDRLKSVLEEGRAS